ncbi:hypothetical protein L1049_003698 [Liquidambar formosana]|uniref:Uncharacterized protein n=1 Tax=Liquidambar formosana TaxID=63359 RepID=A0AAP0WV15_LIQFO
MLTLFVTHAFLCSSGAMHGNASSKSNAGQRTSWGDVSDEDSGNGVSMKEENGEESISYSCIASRGFLLVFFGGCYLCLHKLCIFSKLELVLAALGVRCLCVCGSFGLVPFSVRGFSLGSVFVVCRSSDMCTLHKAIHHRVILNKAILLKAIHHKDIHHKDIHQGYPPQGYPPQGYPQAGYPPGAYPPANYPSASHQPGHGPGMGGLIAGGAAAAAAAYGAHQLGHGSHHTAHGTNYGYGSHGQHGKFKHGKFGKQGKLASMGSTESSRNGSDSEFCSLSQLN